jgi:hypothetical protein
MRVVLMLVGALVTGALTAPLPARAEVYKWIDDNGAIHYSNIKPPQSVKVVERFEDAPASTAPAIPREQPASQRDLALEARVAQLERDLYEAQRARDVYEAQRASVTPVGPGYDPYYPGYATYYPGYASYYPGYYPAYGYVVYGFPIAGVRAAHVRRFPVGVRPHVQPFPGGVRPHVQPFPGGGGIAMRTAPARAMHR